MSASKQCGEGVGGGGPENEGNIGNRTLEAKSHWKQFFIIEGRDLKLSLFGV